MRTETITYKIFQFDELDDAGKERAIEWYRTVSQWDWTDEWRKTLEKFAESMPFKVVDWDARPYSYSFIKVDVDVPSDWMNYDDTEPQGYRLFKWLLNHNYVTLANGKSIHDDCPLTGFCGDEDILDPLRAFMRCPTKDATLDALMQECVESWLRGFNADLEHQTTDEYISEEILANEYEFHENGERYT